MAGLTLFAFARDTLQIAQLFNVAEMSKAESGGGEGVKIEKNEPYEDKKHKGQYTHKVRFFDQRSTKDTMTLCCSSVPIGMVLQSNAPTLLHVHRSITLTPRSHPW